MPEILQKLPKTRGNLPQFQIFKKMRSVFHFRLGYPFPQILTLQNLPSRKKLQKILIMWASLLATEHHLKHFHQLLTYFSITDYVGSLFWVTRYTEWYLEKPITIESPMNNILAPLASKPYTHF